MCIEDTRWLKIDPLETITWKALEMKQKPILGVLLTYFTIVIKQPIASAGLPNGKFVWPLVANLAQHSSCSLCFSWLIPWGAFLAPFVEINFKGARKLKGTVCKVWVKNIWFLLSLFGESTHILLPALPSPHEPVGQLTWTNRLSSRRSECVLCKKSSARSQASTCFYLVQLGFFAIVVLQLCERK